MAVKARPVVAPIVTYNWTGCYIGGNAGGGWARTSQTQIAKVGGPAIVPNNDFGVSEGTDWVAGGQIGCDYQFGGNWVVGVQGMYDYTRINSTHNVPTAFPGFPVGSFVSQNQIRDFATATARVGYLFAPQVLGYVKGGGAWTRQDHTFIGTVPAIFLSESALGVNRSGWTVGGGIEWMFAPGWSVFGEYNYMDFGRKDIGFIAGPGPSDFPISCEPVSSCRQPLLVSTTNSTSPSQWWRGTDLLLISKTQKPRHFRGFFVGVEGKPDIRASSAACTPSITTVDFELDPGELESSTLWVTCP